jgi:hypothetical protein
LFNEVGGKLTHEHRSFRYSLQAFRGKITQYDIACSSNSPQIASGVIISVIHVISFLPPIAGAAPLFSNTHPLALLKGQKVRQLPPACVPDFERLGDFSQLGCLPYADRGFQAIPLANFTRR